MIYFTKEHTWEFDANQTTAPNYITEAIGFAGLLAMDFGGPIADDDSISSITTTAVADIADITEPTISSSAIHTDKQHVVLTMATASSGAATFTITVKVVTVDGQTYVRKGRLVLA